jgi:hypothetical protein
LSRWPHVGACVSGCRGDARAPTGHSWRRAPELRDGRGDDDELFCGYSGKISGVVGEGYTVRCEVGCEIRTHGERRRISFHPSHQVLGEIYFNYHNMDIALTGAGSERGWGQNRNSVV